MSNEKPAKIIPTRANTGNPSGNGFRDGFSSDESYIHWIEANNLRNGNLIRQVEVKLAVAEKLIGMLGGG